MKRESMMFPGTTNRHFGSITLNWTVHSLLCLTFPINLTRQNTRRTSQAKQKASTALKKSVWCTVAWKPLPLEAYVSFLNSEPLPQDKTLVVYLFKYQKTREPSKRSFLFFSFFTFTSLEKKKKKTNQTNKKKTCPSTLSEQTGAELQERKEW